MHIREYAKRGKQFEADLEHAWKQKQGCDRVQREISIPIGKRKGRIDIYIEDEDVALIVEAKSTDWDLIKRSRLREYARLHLRQLFRYADAVLEQTGKGVCVGVTYPKRPKCDERLSELQGVFNEFGSSLSFEHD